jgi:aromatic ring-opening dioxygenase catalytic subunit (LigB family)
MNTDIAELIACSHLPTQFFIMNYARSFEGGMETMTLTTTIETKALLPTYFISHGGGPWPWLKREMPGYEQLEASLQSIPQEIGVTPKAILMISGHWEESTLTVMSSAMPPMIYDYSGFPEHTYRIQYSAPGSPEVASRVQDLLVQAGFPVNLDPSRGFDHGVFAPLVVAYPAANVPVLQLSMRADYDPAAHLAIGRAIVLIIGSGLSYHNLRQMGRQAKVPSQEFDAWLTQAVCESTGAVRNERLMHWSQAPSARLAHPREDHLVPLFVAVGAAEAESGDRIYHEEAFMGGVAVSSFRFG